ncbi:MAG: DUF362 domain-containing protein [Bryobacteraceae bacterium]
MPQNVSSLITAKIQASIAFKLLGIDEVVRRQGASLLNFAEDQWDTVTLPAGRISNQIEVPRTVRTAAVFINFTKLKTNGLTKMTGALKNLFALFRIKRKVTLHGRIDDAIVDSNCAVRPTFSMIDGYLGMEGIGGPAFGTPRKCGLLIASTNPVCADACAAKIMGFRPRAVRHVAAAARAGVGPLTYGLVTDVPRFSYSDYRFRFPLWEYTLRNALKARAGISA